jgi:hypothetical protein
MQIESKYDKNTMALIPGEPIILNVNSSEMEGIDDEKLFKVITHEMCHALNPGDGHGPRFVASLRARGIDTLEAAGVGAMVTQTHSIIPGQVAERLLREWRKENPGGVVRRQAPSGRNTLPAVAVVPDRRGGAPAAHATRVTRPHDAPTIGAADAQKKYNRVNVYCDFSLSMAGEGIKNLIDALKSVWPIPNATLYIYASGVLGVRDPDDALAHRNDASIGFGTHFAPIMEHAENCGDVDMVFIYSDGVPSDKDATRSVWDRTRFPISTHYCVSVGAADAATAYATGIFNGPEGAQYLKGLCRGGGTFTMGDKAHEMADGVAGATGIVSVDRRPVDPRDQMQTAVKRAEGKHGVNQRLVDLGGRQSQTEADVDALNQRVKAYGALEKVFANIDALAVETFAAQDAQDDRDRESRRLNSDRIDAGIANIGGRVLEAIRDGHAGQLNAIASRVESARDGSAAPSIGQVRLGRVEQKVGAYIGASNSGQAQIAPPVGAGADRAPSSARIAPPQSMAALPPPPQTAVPVDPSSRISRVLTPVRRK